MRKIFSSKSAIFLLFVAGISLLVFLNFKGFLNVPKNLAYRFLSPAQKILYKSSNAAANFASAVFSSFTLEKKNRELEAKIVELKDELITLKETRRENEELRKQLGLETANNFILTLANVIGRDSGNLERHLIIDKGIADGITVGDPVIAAGGAAIGRVTETAEKISNIFLFTDPESAVNVMTQDSRITCLLRGSADGNSYLEMIPQDKSIRKGEAIITSGLGKIFPKGLPVGEIEETIENDINIFKQAKVRLLADSSNLEIVFILKSVK